MSKKGFYHSERLIEYISLESEHNFAIEFRALEVWWHTHKNSINASSIYNWNVTLITTQQQN